MILPDSTILIDYMQRLATRVGAGMIVDAGACAANLELTHGALFSQRVLLALVAGGLEPRRGLPDRPGDGAARLGEGIPLRSCWPPIRATEELDLDALFDYAYFTRHAAEIVGRLDGHRLSARGATSSFLLRRRAGG